MLKQGFFHESYATRSTGVRLTTKSTKQKN